jgi:hypothetical protein
MRAENLQVLTVDIQRQWPGATVWGEGDTAHRTSTSDHNEDDTPGSKSEQSDSDNIPEHRALDIPRLGPMTMPTLRELRRRLTDRPANRERLRYVILEQTIWRKKNGWKPERYNGKFHDHLHISSDVKDDHNRKSWNVGPDNVSTPKEREYEMRILAARLHLPGENARSTVWTGLRHHWPLTAETDEETVRALVYAGAVEVTFRSPTALVKALGTLPEKTFEESVNAVKTAG